MFERYTENARRTIFIGRWEARHQPTVTSSMPKTFWNRSRRDSERGMYNTLRCYAGAVSHGGTHWTQRSRVYMACVFYLFSLLHPPGYSVAFRPVRKSRYALSITYATAHNFAC